MEQKYIVIFDKNMKYARVESIDKQFKSSKYKVYDSYSFHSYIERGLNALEQEGLLPNDRAIVNDIINALAIGLADRA